MLPLNGLVMEAAGPEGTGTIAGPFGRGGRLDPLRSDRSAYNGPDVGTTLAAPAYAS